MSLASYVVPCTVICLLVGGCAVQPTSHDLEPLTTLVLVDEASSLTLGAFPLDRKVYAQAILSAKKAGARGLALKFFFEGPSKSESDRALAEAAREFPVLMQVSPGATDSRLPPRLARPDWQLANVPEPMRLPGITHPLTHMEEAAKALGFVEVRAAGIEEAVEVAALVAAAPIQSLQVAIIEQALGVKAAVTGRSLSIGGKQLALDPQGRVPCAWFPGAEARVHGIDSLLAGTIPPEHIRGKVIVLGYGRKNSPTVVVAGKVVPIHVAFYKQTACLARLVTDSR